MKSMSFGVLSLLVMILFSASAFAQEKTENKKEVKTEKMQPEKKEIVIEESAPVNSVCIVSHEEVDPEITYKYENKTYAFCCKKCLAKFKKDPEKYISRLEKEKKLEKNSESKKSEDTKQ